MTHSFPTRRSSDLAVPCIVKPADGDISAEEDSYAENTYREPLHPLDQFRAMQVMVDERQDIEAIAAHFMTTPAVVRQRLKLARSEEHTSELNSLMRISYAVFCLKKKTHCTTSTKTEKQYTIQTNTKILNNYNLY